MGGSNDWGNKDILDLATLWGVLSKIWIDPESKEAAPVRQFMRVVFPAPFGPIKANISPFLIERDTPSTAKMSEKDF